MRRTVGVMMRRLQILVALGVTLTLCYLGLVVFAFGGLEAYQPPFEIVVPESVKGVICATSRPGTTEATDRIVRHEVDNQGQLLVDGDILRSHRLVKLLIRTGADHFVEAQRDSLIPIFTENDLATGEWYTVMWLGSSAEWDSYRRSKDGEKFCLGRFQTSNAK